MVDDVFSATGYIQRADSGFGISIVWFEYSFSAKLLLRDALLQNRKTFGIPNHV